MASACTGALPILHDEGNLLPEHLLLCYCIAGIFPGGFSCVGLCQRSSQELLQLLGGAHPMLVPRRGRVALGSETGCQGDEKEAHDMHHSERI